MRRLAIWGLRVGFVAVAVVGSSVPGPSIASTPRSVVKAGQTRTAYETKVDELAAQDSSAGCDRIGWGPTPAQHDGGEFVEKVTHFGACDGAVMLTAFCMEDIPVNSISLTKSSKRDWIWCYIGVIVGARSVVVSPSDFALIDADDFRYEADPEAALAVDNKSALTEDAVLARDVGQGVVLFDVRTDAARPLRLEYRRDTEPLRSTPLTIILDPAVKASDVAATRSENDLHVNASIDEASEKAASSATSFYPPAVAKLVESDHPTDCDEIGWAALPTDNDLADRLNHYGACAATGVIYIATCADSAQDVDAITGPSDGFRWVFCAVHIKNSSGKALLVSPTDFAILDIHNKRHNVDYKAMLVMGTDRLLDVDELPTGQMVEGMVAFSVGRNAEGPLRLEWRPSLDLGPGNADPLVIIVDRTMNLSDLAN